MTIADVFAGGPVGLETLAATTGEDPVTIEDVYEPFLLQNGFIQKTPRGRMLTQRAFEHLKIPVPKQYRETRKKELENISIDSLLDT